MRFPYFDLFLQYYVPQIHPILVSQLKTLLTFRKKSAILIVPFGPIDSLVESISPVVRVSSRRGMAASQTVFLFPIFPVSIIAIVKNVLFCYNILELTQKNALAGFWQGMTKSEGCIARMGWYGRLGSSLFN